MLKGSHSVWFRSIATTLVFSSMVICSDILTLSSLSHLALAMFWEFAKQITLRTLLHPVMTFSLCWKDLAQDCLRLSQFLYILILHCIWSYPELTDLGIDVLALSHSL